MSATRNRAEVLLKKFGGAGPHSRLAKQAKIFQKPFTDEDYEGQAQIVVCLATYGEPGTEEYRGSYKVRFFSGDNNGKPKLEDESFVRTIFPRHFVPENANI